MLIDVCENGMDIMRTASIRNVINERRHFPSIFLLFTFPGEGCKIIDDGSGGVGTAD